MDPGELREQFRPTSYTEQARRILRRYILNGTFQPGERVKEAEIARTLGVSRGPVREAVLSLASEGLLELYPQRGAFVRSFDARDVRNLWEVREILERQSAQLAAQRAGEEEIQELKDSLDSLERALDQSESKYGKFKDYEPGELYTGAFDFHGQVSRLAQNERLTHYLREINVQLELSRSRSVISPGRAAKTRVEHMAIYEAIAQSDPQAAERAMSTHIHNGRQSAEKSL